MAKLEDVAGSRMFSTASPDSLTSVTRAQCEPPSQGVVTVLKLRGWLPLQPLLLHWPMSCCLLQVYSSVLEVTSNPLMFDFLAV